MDSKQSTLSLQVIDLWRTLEALSPCAPPREERERHIWSAESPLRLPWHEQLKPLYADTPEERWQFVVYIGIFSMDDVLTSLSHILQIPTIRERNGNKEEVALACLVLDAHGRVVGEPSVSSVPWALQELAAGRSFRHWPSTEDELKESIKRYLGERKLLRLSEDEEASTTRTPFTPEDALAIVHIIHNSAEWFPRSKIKHTMRFKGHKLKIRKDKTFPILEPDLFNSFYLNDLERISDGIQNNLVGNGLSSYLLGVPESERVDIRQGSTIIDLVSPTLLSPARWPAPGDHPLVLSQQAALNACLTTLNSPGLFAVNGPPGTGKTTLLRDLIASIITERAKVLAEYEKAEDAFSSRTRLQGRAASHWALDHKLRGFEIVVASNNNGAVENITREIPGIDAIDERWADEVDYFREIADILAAPENDLELVGSSWALLGAVLGKQENRNAFLTRFWFGKKRDDESYHPCFRHLLSSTQSSGEGWKEARRRFLDAISDFEEKRKELCSIESHFKNLRDRRREVEEAEASLLTRKQHGVSLREKRRTLEKQREKLQGRVELLTRLLDHATQIDKSRREIDGNLEDEERYQRTLKAADEELELWLSQKEAIKAAIRELTSRLPTLENDKPSFMARLFSFASMRRWRGEHDRLMQELATQREELRRADEQILQQEARIRSLKEAMSSIELQEDELKQREEQHLRDIQALQEREFSNLVAALVEPKSFGHAFGRIKERAAKAVTLYQEIRREIECLQREIEELKREIKIGEEGLKRLYSSLTGLTEKVRQMKGAFPIPDEVWMGQDDDERERSSPWMDEALHDIRVRCFLEALALHRAFILSNSEKVRAGLSAWTDIISRKIKGTEGHDDIAGLWSLFSLVVPVISTTFASVDRLFRGVGCEALGWVLIDEAGQATPQSALGAVWRAQRTVIIGDPLQLEPINRLPNEAIQAIRSRLEVGHEWDPSLVSAQSLGDRATRIGTSLRTTEDRLWVGSPLRVHRRCSEPMFSISNSIAYDKMMVMGRGSSDYDTALGKTRWIHVSGGTKRGHFIEEEGAVAREFVERATRESYERSGSLPHLFLLSPFRDVVEGMRELLREEYDPEWIKLVVGTIHTFQGREAEMVILLLGGDPHNRGAKGWASSKPNLLNVAVTRAKERLYVIGDRVEWERYPYFSDLSSALRDTEVEKAA